MQGQKTRWHRRLCQHPEDCRCLVWAESQQASLNPLLLPRAPQFQAELPPLLEGDKPSPRNSCQRQ